VPYSPPSMLDFRRLPNSFSFTPIRVRMSVMSPAFWRNGKAPAVDAGAFVCASVLHPLKHIEDAISPRVVPLALEVQVSCRLE
jgi:hypothetical protein